MPDLREQLRRIETSTPPDLWSEIELRALQDRPETEPDVIVFRPRGTDIRRRIAAGLVAAAVFALAAFAVWEASRTASPRPKQAGSELPENWVRCTSALGYSIGYPGDWHTTDVFDGSRDPANACRWFSPDPFGPQGNVVPEGWAYPLEVSIRGPFQQVRRQEIDPDLVDVSVNEPLEVDGHRAARLEYESVNDLVGEPGLHYEYVIELDPETTLIVHTTATRGIAGVYAENKVVVDYAVDSLRFLSNA
jgi:hypothetical protein